MFEALQKLTIKQSQALDKNAQLIVIHPNYVEQHLLMDEFVGDKALYVRLDGQGLSRSQLQAQFDAAVATQITGNIPDSTVVILDECDRVDDSILGDFLLDILAIPATEKIIIFGRKIPHCILDNPSLHGQTVILPTDESLMLLDYAKHTSKSMLLEVRAFGEGHVILNGCTIDNWDGVLPRALFFYLVDRGIATREKIFQTFWPELSKKEATNIFHVTKRKINDSLGMDLTVYKSGFYCISPDIQLSYDAVSFATMLQNSAIASPDEAVDLLTRSMLLYRGHFLCSMNIKWANNRRYEFREEYSTVLAELARLKEESGDIHAALGLYLAAAANDRFREELVYNVMRLYDALDMQADALSVYDTLVIGMPDGTVPSHNLQHFADAIRQKTNSMQDNNR